MTLERASASDGVDAGGGCGENSLMRLAVCVSVLISATLLAGASHAGTPQPPPRLLTGDIYEHSAAVRPAVVIVAGDGSWALGGIDGTGRGDPRSPRFLGHITWLMWTQRSARGVGATWDTCLACRVAIQPHGRQVVIEATEPRRGYFTYLRIGRSCWETGVTGHPGFSPVTCR